MYLENITLNFIQPCTTDSLRIRIKAVTSRNISDIFPYLNSYAPPFYCNITPIARSPLKSIFSSTSGGNKSIVDL